MNLSSFPHFEAELIAEIEKAGTVSCFQSGAMPVKRGQLLRVSYLIEEGCIKVIQENQQGDEFVVAYLKQGDSFALSICEDSLPKTKISQLSFSVLVPSKLIALPFTEKDRLAMKYNSFYKYILHSAVLFAEFYREVIDHIVFHNMDTRIGYFLTRLSNIKQTAELTITHQEIADGLNSSREVVSRILKKMEDAGQIKMSQNSIIIS